MERTHLSCDLVTVRILNQTVRNRRWKKNWTALVIVKNLSVQMVSLRTVAESDTVRKLNLTHVPVTGTMNLHH